MFQLQTVYENGELIWGQEPGPPWGEDPEITIFSRDGGLWEPKVSRPIFYIENIRPGDSLVFDFQIEAMYPVKAKAVSSQAYSYYKPDWRGETLGRDVRVIRQ